MGSRRNFLKISAPLPLIRTFRMSPLLARSISLDGTFNEMEQEKKNFITRTDHACECRNSVCSHWGGEDWLDRRAYVGVDVVLHEGGVKSSNRFQLVIRIQVISQLFQFGGIWTLMLT
jgi:hypothetical protein